MRSHDEDVQKSKLQSESFHSPNAIFALGGANKMIDKVKEAEM